MAMKLGDIIKKERVKKKISLRDFARRLKISPSYVVDLEKGRRIPNHELLKRISDLLDLPVGMLNRHNLEMPNQVKEWIQEHPLFSKLLRFVLRQRDPVRAIEELEAVPQKTTAQKSFLIIYESELQAIGLESSSWDVETGGDLFGIWTDIPIIYLATRAGPKAVRNNAHFRLDVDYLIKISAELSNDWGLRYFGDWHSHHKLGLCSPSGGDQIRIKRIAEKNNFEGMAEFITSFMNDSSQNRIVRLDSFVYRNSSEASPLESYLVVLRGLSPIREALIKRKMFSEQHLESYSLFDIQKIKGPEEPFGRVPSGEGNPQKLISERLFLNAVTELKRVSSQDIETHLTSFGKVLVVAVKEEQYVAFAVDDNWPHKILEVDWMDRKTGRSNEIEIEDIADLSLLNLNAVINSYKHIVEMKK